MGKSRLSRRITWRVILIMVLFNVFIVGVVFLFDLAVSQVENETLAQHIIEGIEGRLQTMLKGVEVSAANNVAEFEKNLDSPQTVYDAMEREFQLNGAPPGARNGGRTAWIGCGIGFEPGYFAGEGRWFEPYVKQGERRQIGSAQHDYFAQEWYVKGLALEKGEGSLTDPYLDNDGGNCVLTTYVTPLFDPQGRKAGVYGIDLDLSWFEETISKEEKRVRQNSMVADDNDEYLFFIQILDSKGRYITNKGVDWDQPTHQMLMEPQGVEFKKVKTADGTYYVSNKRIEGTGWTLVVAQHWDFVMFDGIVLGFIIIVLMTVGGVVMFFFMSYGIRRAVKPLRALSESAQEVARGNFDSQLPAFRHESEISQLRDSFQAMQRSLKQYIEELKASTAAKASMESELNVAQAIQKSMLPKEFPPFPGRTDIDLYGIQNPAKAVGGDLFDFFLAPGADGAKPAETLFFCIGDVSGKGVPASLVMAVTRTLFRNVAAHTPEPHLIMEAMNAALCDGNDNNMFVTLFIGVLHLPTGRLRYCNAGHDAPFLDASLLPCYSNLPLGIMPDTKYAEQQAAMATGSTLFLYTDGLTEAENAHHKLFGLDRVTSVVAPFEGSPQQLIETMTSAVRQFVGDTEQSDDLTMLAIRRLAAP